MILPGMPGMPGGGPEALKSRLIARGRETLEEITARLQQARAFSDLMPGNLIRIDNNGDIE